MSLQATYVNALERFRDIARENVDDFDQETVKRSQEFRDQIAEFRVLIPVVGLFNVGKTSLVNAYLGRGPDQGLPTDIVPQTALATEIHYVPEAEQERVDLFGEDDRRLRQITLAEFRLEEQRVREAGTAPAALADHARAMLHADVLRHTDRKVLVDMPGLGSGLEAHNTAILRYLPRGSFFILVIDVANGGLRESEIRQLGEFLDHEIEFAVLVNKTDRKRAPDVEAVVTHVDEQVRNAFGKPAAVFPVSAHAGDITAFRETVESVDFDRALRSFWRPWIVGLFDEAIARLRTRYSALGATSAESEAVIADLQDKKARLEKKLRNDEQEIREQYDSAADRVVRNTRAVIQERARWLAERYEAGGQNEFSREINELVRRTIDRSEKRELSRAHQQTTERYQAEMNDIDTRYEQFLDLGADDSGRPASTSITQVLGEAAMTSARVFADAPVRLLGSRGGGEISAITDLVKVVSALWKPWRTAVALALPQMVGVFVDMLPTIVDMVAAGVSGKSQRADRMRKLQQNIEGQVAPRMASSLRDQITTSYGEAAREMIAGLREQVRDRVDKITNDIRRVHSEIEEQHQDVERRRNSLHDVIRQLVEARQQVDEGR